MPRGATIVTENNFTRGLITEFTAMNFPENAVTDGDNVVFSELGVVSRRKAIDYEDDYQIHTLSALSSNTGVFIEFKWDSVGGDGTTSFIAQQIGSVIRFFEVGQQAVSTELKSFSVDLNTYKTVTDISQVASQPCQFASGKGYLFIVHPLCEPISVSYDKATDSITVSQITIEVRDFERLDDGLKTDERPTVLSNIHKYNLYNQGWYIDAISRGNATPANVLTAWDSVRTDFPSNADIWWIYKNGQEIAYFGVTKADGFIGPSNVTLGNTPAPSGHYIYDAWNVNRTAVSGIAGLPTLTSGSQRPSCIAFYAGRIFYAGVSSDKYSDKVYFSQIIESDDQFGKCYQINDPTSESVFDLIDTDGGIISMPMISKVISLQIVNDALIVIGTNGVFAIRGTENGPFKATDYSVEYVSSIGGISNTSVINVDNSLLWWNYDALYALTKDQIGVYYQVENASKQTIQSVINEVPPMNKPYVKGAYNKKEQIVQWLYNDVPDADPYTYNRILEFNVVSKAFYTHTISTDLAPRIVGLLSLSGQKKVKITQDVTDRFGDPVLTVTLQNVTIDEEVFNPTTEYFKYATSGVIDGSNVGFTYSNSTEGYSDWAAIGGSTYFSFFESGYRIRGEMLRSFTSTPISVVLKNVSTAEVILKGIWDYGYRTSMPQWLYGIARESDIRHGRIRGDYIIRRVKIRGKGKAFQLRFESEEDFPFEIVGWTTFDTGGQQP